MVNFGFFDDWHPKPGRITSWTVPATALAVMREAPAHPVPPSYQQREYLRTTQRTAAAGHRASRLCMISYDIPGTPDIDAMTRAVTAFVRRHDSFCSWFTVEPDRVVRHVVDANTLELVPADHGDFADSDAIRRHVQDTTPDALHWNCFSFGIIEQDRAFTVYAAVDHLHTDGVAEALTCVDLLMLYGAHLSGTEPALAPVDGHLAYCERERAENAALTAQSPPVRTWLKLLQRNGGEMPAFPLYLGSATTHGYVRGAVLTLPLFTEADALRFEQACADGGGRFLGGLFAALALTEVELTGTDWHFILSPANTRSTPGEAGAVGYYTNLLPIAFDVPPDARFSTLVAAAQNAADQAKALTGVSPHRVLELAAPEDGIRVRPGWAAMMLSYVDVRKITGVDMFDRINGGLFANRAAASEVYVWINRFPDVTTLSLVFPDTEDANESVGRYVETLTEITAAVAAAGDYALRCAA